MEFSHSLVIRVILAARPSLPVYLDKTARAVSLDTGDVAAVERFFANEATTPFYNALKSAEEKDFAAIYVAAR